MTAEILSQSPVRPHWSGEIDAILEKLQRHPQILIGSDFDGTLAAIVERPEEARLAAANRNALEELARLHPRVRLAFLSGRSLGDLVERVGAGGETVFAGNHGLEISGGGLDWIHPSVAKARPHLDDLLADFDTRFLGIPGIELEDKGLSITLHYRRMIAEWIPLLNEALDSLVLPAELRRHEGKMVFEFRPAVDWNKGLAIRRIADHLKIPHEAVVFLGDDVTDEDAFRELGAGSTTVHVGSAFSPSLARLNAATPDDVASFLGAIAEGLGVVF
jgi:trehalose 6-phosphate phosphatase